MKTVIFSTIFFPLALLAQTPKQNPIDKALDDCMNKAGGETTAGMVGCMQKAYDSWDKELNKVYNALRGKLDAKGKETLKTTQLQWLKFRDEEFKLLNDVYSRVDGTMYVPMQVSDKVSIVKERTLQLQSLLQLLENRE